MTRDPLLARVLHRIGGARWRCPADCLAGLVMDYDARGDRHWRACMVCGGRGTVGTGYTPTAPAREETSA